MRLRCRAGDIAFGAKHPRCIFFVIGRSPKDIEDRYGGPRWFTIMMTGAKGEAPVTKCHVPDNDLTPRMEIADREVEEEMKKLASLKLSRFQQQRSLQLAKKRAQTQPGHVKPKDDPIR